MKTLFSDALKMNTLDHALAYAEKGFPVLPVVPNEKRPLVFGGLRVASRDPAQITEWFLRWTRANIGLRTDGVLVVDIDAGAEWPPAGLAEDIKTASPPIQKTPRGGWHLFFRLPEGKDYRPSVGRVAPHVDIRAGAAAYVVVYPSRTPSGVYEWKRPLTSFKDLPQPPPSLIDVLDVAYRKKPTRPVPFAGVRWTAGVVCEGQRNDALFRFGCRLRQQGYSIEEIREFLEEINTTHVNPSLSSEEIGKICESVNKYPQPHPAIAREWRLRR